MNPKIKTIIMIVAEIVFLIRDVRLSPSTEASLMVLLFLLIVLTGSKHAFHYASGPMLQPMNSLRLRIYKHFEIHVTQRWLEFGSFILLVLAGVEPFKVLGTQFLARIPFQGLINWGSGKPFIDKDESKTYTYVRGRYFLRLRNKIRKLFGKSLIIYDTTPVMVKKFLPGYKSLWKIVFGVVLIGSTILWQYLKQNL